MTQAWMALLVVAALSFSLAIALLVEELVVGRMFHLLFARAQAQVSEQRRKENHYVAD